MTSIAASLDKIAEAYQALIKAQIATLESPKKEAGEVINANIKKGNSTVRDVEPAVTGE
jgi:hypothetical protein